MATNDETILITDLSSASQIQGSEWVMVVQDGLAKKATAEQVGANSIPLTGTKTGKQVTGNVEFTTGKGLVNNECTIGFEQKGIRLFAQDKTIDLDVNVGDINFITERGRALYNGMEVATLGNLDDYIPLSGTAKELPVTGEIFFSPEASLSAQSGSGSIVFRQETGGISHIVLQTAGRNDSIRLNAASVSVNDSEVITEKIADINYVRTNRSDARTTIVNENHGITLRTEASGDIVMEPAGIASYKNSEIATAKDLLPLVRNGVNPDEVEIFTRENIRLVSSDKDILLEAESGTVEIGAPKDVTLASWNGTINLNADGKISMESNSDINFQVPRGEGYKVTYNGKEFATIDDMPDESVFIANSGSDDSPAIISEGGFTLQTKGGAGVPTIDILSAGIIRLKSSGTPGIMIDGNDTGDIALITKAGKATYNGKEVATIDDIPDISACLKNGSNEKIAITTEGDTLIQSQGGMYLHTFGGSINLNTSNPLFSINLASVNAISLSATKRVTLSTPADGDVAIQSPASSGKATYKGIEIATKNDIDNIIPEHTESTGSTSVTVPVGSKILSVNYNRQMLFPDDYTISGNTLTVTNTEITSGPESTDRIVVTYF